MILVFKTSISNKKELDKATPYLDITLQNARWNLDLEDCDHVLRIDSRIDVSDKIVQSLTSIGFSCEELE
jgi:hypothetical protein